MSDHENVPMEAPPRRRRRRPDIYDVKHMIRMFVTVMIGATVAWGVILGDIWLWRMLYG